jgi:tetratricopeptide (TPR) repeat protein
MWFGALGPLLVRDEDRQVAVPKGRQRVLLAALLMHAGQLVPADALAEVVWDGSPPPGALVTLRSHVSRLRGVLGPRAGARLVTRHPGYLLQAGKDEVDVLRFRCLCQDGGAALREGAWDRAFCQRALSLSTDVGHRRLEGSGWDSLGYAEHHLGNFAEAAACYERALGICREFGDRYREATILTHLGDTCHAAGDLPQACQAWQRALAILEDIQHPDAAEVRAKLDRAGPSMSSSGCPAGL